MNLRTEAVNMEQVLGGLVLWSSKTWVSLTYKNEPSCTKAFADGSLIPRQIVPIKISFQNPNT